MHKTRGPSSISTNVPKDALDLSLSGSQLSVSKRPSTASSGKCLSRSVSVACDSRGKRNALSDASFGSSHSIKNLRRSNSTTQVNQQANISQSQDKTEQYLVLFESSSDEGKTLPEHSKASPDKTTWNILDDQPRSFLPHTSSHAANSTSSLRTREPAIALAAIFTANNRSNKAAVGNSVTAILHNNYSEKPLTPKSSNQKPSFNNILKATANDDLPMEKSSVTKYQKNFSSPSSTSYNKSVEPGSPALPQGTEVTEEEAERFIQHVSQAAIMIQRWYRSNVKTRQANQAALKCILTSKRKEWEGRTEQDGHREQPLKSDEERKLIRKEKALLARIAAIQELQQRQCRRVPEVQHEAEEKLESLKHPCVVGCNNSTRFSITKRSPATSPSNCSPVLPTVKARNIESTFNIASNLGKMTFRAVSPALSNPRHSQCSQELQQKAQPITDVQQTTEVENLRQTDVILHKKPPNISATNRSPVSSSNNSPMSSTDVKTKNTETSPNVLTDFVELSFRAISPTSSNHRGSHCSQRSVSVEDQQQGESSKTNLHELLETLKLLEEEPESMYKPKCKEKYTENGDSNSLTTDNLERHGQLSHHPALPDDGALLSEAKLQSIMSFLNEMEKSEQERPRSMTSGSQREAVLSEDELAVVEQASATAADVTSSMMRIKLELEEKKRTINILQAALVQQRELTMRHVSETEKELKRNLELQKEQYEATIQRHLTFIDQLISDKKALSERCEGVVGELKQVDQKYTKKMTQMQEQHELEIKKLKDLMCATEKIRREKWIDEKTKKIKEITVKGLEPEIQKLISKHKQELKKLRTLHEAELLQADDRAAQHYIHQCEELRAQLEKEKDEQCHREREVANQRYEKQLQEQELILQQQRRRLLKEVAEEKERLAQLAARQRAELEDLRQQLQDNSCVARRALTEELDKSREEQERRHQMEVKSLRECLEIEKQTWEEKYKKREEARLLSRERELKDQLRRERDKEIQLAICTLEEETSKDREECERAAENRVKRLREKYETELQELECSERIAVEKQQDLRKQKVEMEAELVRFQAELRRKHQEIDDLTKTRDKLMNERRSLAEVIRQEFSDQLVMTEEENRQMKVEVSEVRARLRLEVQRVTREKEEQLAEVHQRVKSAILKKEETVCNLRRQYEAAMKRADHLEALWEQQRKQLMEQ